jgi:hypothetical protein
MTARRNRTGHTVGIQIEALRQAVAAERRRRSVANYVKVLIVPDTDMVTAPCST